MKRCSKIYCDSIVLLFQTPVTVKVVSVRLRVVALERRRRWWR